MIYFKLTLFFVLFASQAFALSLEQVKTALKEGVIPRDSVEMNLRVSVKAQGVYQQTDIYIVNKGTGKSYTEIPMGWHLPNSGEWQILFDNVGGVDSAGFHLKAVAGWISLNPGWISNGTDDCGFALLPIPASTIATNSNSYNEKRDGYIAFAWTSSLQNDYTMLGVLFETQRLDARIIPYYTVDYLPVRCVKD